MGALMASKRRKGRGTLDRAQAFLESFLPSRFIICLSPLLVFSDVITDILSTFEFAVPSDGGPTEKWWTGLSCFFLYMSFRIQFVRFLRQIPANWSLRRRVYFCNEIGGHLDMRLCSLLKVMTPFSLAFDIFPPTIFARFNIQEMVFFELFMLLFWPIYPIVLVKELFDMVRDSWKRTGQGEGVPFELISMAIIEAMESLSQLAIQTRAYSVGALSESLFVTSAVFSLIGIVKAVLVYLLSYKGSEAGEVMCRLQVDLSRRGLSNLPKSKYIRGDPCVVKEIILGANNLKNVTADDWLTFLSTFPRLTMIYLGE